MKLDPEFPWATVTVITITLIVAIAGAIVVIFGKDGALTFDQYLEALSKFIIGVGILGVGRGIRRTGR